jgi:hypothetical protein
MPNNKKNKRQKTQGSSARSQRGTDNTVVRNRGMSVRVENPTHESFRGSLDPFNSSQGFIPDGSGMRVLPYTFRNVYPLATDANGDGNVTFLTARLYQRVYTASTWSAGDVTAHTVTNIPQYTTAAASLKEYRIVSQGYIYHCTQSYDKQVGTLAVKGFGEVASATNVPNWQTITPVQDYCSVSGHRVLKIQPTGPRAFDFRGLGDGVQDWANVAFFINGGPASVTVGVIEEIVKVEFIPIVGTLYSLITRQPAMRNSALLDALYSATSGTVEVADNVEHYANRATQIMRTLGGAFLSARAVMRAMGGRAVPRLEL